MEEDNLLSLHHKSTHTKLYLHARCTITHHKTMPHSHHSAGRPWPYGSQKVQMEKSSTSKRLNRADIHLALNPRLTSTSQWEKTIKVVPVHYMQTTYKMISRLLTKFDIWTVHVPTKNNAHLLTSVADDFGSKCVCGPDGLYHDINMKEHEDTYNYSKLTSQSRRTQHCGRADKLQSEEGHAHLTAP
jgi:hypothetical protein